MKCVLSKEVCTLGCDRIRTVCNGKQLGHRYCKKKSHLPGKISPGKISQVKIRTPSSLDGLINRFDMIDDVIISHVPHSPQAF
jgi:hypothetical protein